MGKFRRFFPAGFRDATYLAWERNYKWEAHQRWNKVLGKTSYQRLLEAKSYRLIADHAFRIESRTNLLFSFEKMALRDAVRSPDGAREFALGLHAWLHGTGSRSERFLRWIEVLSSLPQKQKRVLTWPTATVFGFIARPGQHIFVKPTVTKKAAAAFVYPLRYESRPNSGVYQDVLSFGKLVCAHAADLAPRDLIDIQSFIWVLGSSEYD